MLAHQTNQCSGIGADWRRDGRDAAPGAQNVARTRIERDLRQNGAAHVAIGQRADQTVVTIDDQGDTAQARIDTDHHVTDPRRWSHDEALDITEWHGRSLVYRLLKRIRRGAADVATSSN